MHSLNISPRRVACGVAYGAALGGVMLVAVVANAQNGIGHPRGWEIGIAPAMRHLGGELSAPSSRSSMGFVASAQYNATPILGLRASIMRSHNKQMGGGSWPSLNETLPMVAAVVTPRMGHALRPYALAGVGYRSVSFTGPRCDCATELEFATPVLGVGAQFQASSYTALRAEFEVNPRSNVSSSQFLLGVAVAPGKMFGRRKTVLHVSQKAAPAPVSVPAPVVAVTTVRRVSVDTLVVKTIVTHDTVPALVPKPAVAPVAPLLVIPGAQFEVGKSALTPTAIHALVEFANQLNADGHRNVSIDVVGYTDNMGSADANLALGLKRAKAVQEALIEAHLDSNRISVNSGGASNFVASNDTKAGRQQNRRVVITRRVNTAGN